eukprot:8148753-Alexandrium_andersonii.AAC.1
MEIGWWTPEEWAQWRNGSWYSTQQTSTPAASVGGPWQPSQAWGWSANAGGTPGQHSGGGSMPQTSAPAGAQSATADGTWQPAQAWGWSANAGGAPGQASDPLPDAWAAWSCGSWAAPSPRP